jgi:uncharacterized phage infection (PIP) family protein YhgE
MNENQINNNALYIKGENDIDNYTSKDMPFQHDESLRERIKKQIYSFSPQEDTNCNQYYYNMEYYNDVVNKEDNENKYMNNDNNYVFDINATLKKISQLENSVNDLNAKNEELTKHLDNYKQQNTNQNNISINSTGLTQNNSHLLPNQPQNTQKILFELQALKQEQAKLISQNIIYQEDISRLSDLTNHLEQELNNQRQRNYELATENDKLHKDLINLHITIDKTNNQIAQIKVQEHNTMEDLKYINDLEMQLKATTKELNALKEAHTELSIEHKVFLDKYASLTKLSDDNNKEVNMLKEIQAKKIEEIEFKMETILQETKTVKKENAELKEENANLKKELEEVTKLRDIFKDKYNEMKNKNDVLNMNVDELMKEFNAFKEEMELIEAKRLKDEAIKKDKLLSRSKLVADLQRRITNYRNDRLKKNGEN